MNFDIFTPADVFKDKLMVIAIKRAETNKLKINANLMAEYPIMNELFTSYGMISGMINRTTRLIILSTVKILNNNLS
jgi:hypothetical protein